jgi:hypothetical protein
MINTTAITGIDLTKPLPHKLVALLRSLIKRQFIENLLLLDKPLGN